MKKVVDKHTVAHLWMNQQQDEARTPTSNLYFNKNTIYSYGSHFPIATHCTNKKGEKAILFTTRSYSNTTSQHISIVRSATWGRVVYCENPLSNDEFNFNSFEQDILNISRSLPTARKPEKYINQIQQVNSLIEKYAEFKCVKIPKKLQLVMQIEDVEQYKGILVKRQLAIDRDRKRQLKLKKEREKQALIKLEEDILKWRSLEIQRIECKRLTGFDILRSIKRSRSPEINDYFIETSQHIEIKIDIAKKFYNTIKQVINKEIESPLTFLDYRILNINSDFIEIGCHKIKMEEIETIAKQLEFNE